MQIASMADQDMAARLRRAREEIAGIESAAEAARSLRIDYPTYAAHENGSRGFKGSVARYSGFYKVDLKWLLTGIGSPRGSTIEARVLDLDPDQRKTMMETLELLERLKANRRRI